MGKWDETCAITGLPIHEDTPVVMIVPTYDGITSVWGGSSCHDLNDYVGLIEIGHYDSFGWIKELNPGDKKVCDVYETYLDGFDESLDLNDVELRLNSIFVRKSVWDKLNSDDLSEYGIHEKEIVEFYDLLDKTKAAGLNVLKEPCDRDLLKELHLINLYADKVRIDFKRGLNFKGTQELRSPDVVAGHYRHFADLVGNYNK